MKDTRRERRAGTIAVEHEGPLVTAALVPLVSKGSKGEAEAERRIRSVGLRFFCLGVFLSRWR